MAAQEPEQTWRGELRKRDVTTDPASRTALSYQLVTSDKIFPVHASNVEQKLAPFDGRPVLIYGKLIEVSSKGFGEELRIASIRELP